MKKKDNSKHIRFVFESVGDIKFSLKWLEEIQRLKKTSKVEHTMEYLKYLAKYIRKLENGFNHEFVVTSEESIFDKKERINNMINPDYAKFISGEWTTKYNIMYSDVDKMFYHINKKTTDKRKQYVDIIKKIIETNEEKINKKLSENYKGGLITRLRGLTEDENKKLTLITLVYPKLIHDTINNIDNGTTD